MNMQYYRYLCCPRCRGDLDLRVACRGPEGVKEGTLTCRSCAASFPIVNHIPRFVPRGNHGRSFAFQWDRFHQLRSDPQNRRAFLELAKGTILRRTGWPEAFFGGKMLLECGCGGGHETEALLAMGANVISFDSSNSVDVALEMNPGRHNLLILQADIARLPVRRRAFDVVYCHRVLMHTPDPGASFRSIARRVRPGGAIFAHAYSKRLKSMMHYRYLLRPFTRRMDPETLLGVLRRCGRCMYRVLGWARRHNLGVLRHFIPFENVGHLGPKHGIRLTEQAWFEFSLIVVFDSLTPEYDKPQSWRTMKRWFETEGMEQIAVRRKKPVVITARYPAAGSEGR